MRIKQTQINHRWTKTCSQLTKPLPISCLNVLRASSRPSTTISAVRTSTSISTDRMNYIWNLILFIWSVRSSRSAILLKSSCYNEYFYCISFAFDYLYKSSYYLSLRRISSSYDIFCWLFQFSTAILSFSSFLNSSICTFI